MGVEILGGKSPSGGNCPGGEWHGGKSARG